jgi:hypothetical protein
MIAKLVNAHTNSRCNPHPMHIWLTYDQLTCIWKNVCMNWTLNVESSKEPPKHNKANFTWIMKLFIALNQPYLEMVHVGFIIAYTKNWTKVHVWQWSTTLTILNLEFHKTFLINKLAFPFPLIILATCEKCSESTFCFLAKFL